MKITIGVMGASHIPGREVADQARLIGTLIGKAGLTLITGATTGLPFEAACGAQEAGGEVIGFSPAGSAEEHHRMGLPVVPHDLIIYTGLGFKGRNLLNVGACMGILFVGGSMGALNEFTIAYDEEMIMGILEGSGGFCNHMRSWILELAKPGNRSIIHYSADPETLVRKVLDSVRDRYFKQDAELP